MRSRNFVTNLSNIIKTSSCGHSYLIGSEPRKSWCIVYVCCICVYGYVSVVLRRIYITVKEVNYNLWMCMNAKICKDILSAQLIGNKVEVYLF